MNNHSLFTPSLKNMSKTNLKTSLAVAAVFIALLPTTARAQNAPDSTGSLLVFVDCDVRNCDFDHLRREIPWVNWARDREDSDVHILATSQRTGGQGEQYTFAYIGRGRFAGQDKTLGYTSDPDATDSEVRDGITNVIAVGLVQYVETTPLISNLRVQRQDTGEGQATTSEQDEDPWNLWVFRVGADVSVEGESRERQYEVDGFITAGRVAEDFKINMEAEVEYDREEFDELGNGNGFVNDVFDYEGRVLAVWSLDDRWSFGSFAEAEKSTFRNQDIQIAGGPALEYNIFPWAESTRRALTFRYVVEMAYFDYELISVEGQTDELLARHSLEISAAVRQPWGEIFGSIEGIQYFNDLATHRIETFLFVEYRLFRGFNVDVFASFDRVKDQFFLPAQAISEEEILRQRRQRETGFRFDFGVGFSYRFGSRFANVVNPRID